MRNISLNLCVGVAVLTLAAAPAVAGECCGHGVVYDPQPVVPTGLYWFAPPPQVSQIYVVNQGPVYGGPGIYAHPNVYVPTLARPADWYRRSIDALAYRAPAAAYPYVRGCGCGDERAYLDRPYRARAFRRYPGTVAPSNGY